VATFGRRGEGQWLPEERFRLINMIVLSHATGVLVERARMWPDCHYVDDCRIAVRVPDIDAVEFNRAVTSSSTPRMAGTPPEQARPAANRPGAPSFSLMRR
jgi:hypothetical protein